MKQNNLDVVNMVPRYRRLKHVRFNGKNFPGGKATHDCVGIAKEIKRTQKRDIDPRSVSRFLSRAEGDIKRGVRSGRFLKGKYLGKKIVVQFNRVLGNVFSERGFENLAKEVWRLALAGENLEDHSRDLCRKYRLPVDCIKEQWDEDQEYFEKLPAQEIEALRNQKYLKPLPWKVRQYWEELQAKNRAQEKIRRAAISA